jgi:retron-type reverse transcriptase
MTGLLWGAGYQGEKVNFILDVDIRSFFDTVDHAWLIRFVEPRICDKRMRAKLKAIKVELRGHECICRSRRRDGGCGKSSPATSTTMPCR